MVGFEVIISTSQSAHINIHLNTDLNWEIKRAFTFQKVPRALGRVLFTAAEHQILQAFSF